MQLGILIFGLFTLFIVIGACLGWVANSRASRLDDKIRKLELRLLTIENRSRVSIREPESPRPEPPAAESAAPESTVVESLSERPAATAMEAPSTPTPSTPSPSTLKKPPPASPGFFDQLLENFQRNWMAWLGGISVALAGIFLIGYGIEMGYLGPTARITAAVIAGLVLHAAAEYFRRKTGSAQPAFAAMAGGASITLYAAFYAALELYGLLSPGLTFTLLAFVSLATMTLATVHGPLLAAIGIIGAYVVPQLVTNNAGGTLIELIYSLIITTAALFLIRFIYRPWLWYGTLAGALGWWMASLHTGDADGFRGLYLAAFTYVALAIPTFDWLLQRRPQPEDPAMERIAVTDDKSFQPLQVAIVLIALAQAVSIINLGFTGFVPALLAWSPLIAVLLWSVRTRETLQFAPWFLLVTQLCAWFYRALDTDFDGIRLIGLAESVQSEFLAFAIVMAILFSLGCKFARQGQVFSHVHTSLMCLSPVLWLALSYLLVTDLSASWEWSLGILALGLIYITLAERRLRSAENDGTALWLLFGGHLAYSLAAATYFSDATLTLALAAQVISLAWLNQRFVHPALEWIIKGVLALVVVRLTLNPWLLTYPTDTHWSLWTYGGSVFCCLVGTVLTPDTRVIRKWLEASTLHLLVLFLGAEIRYQLYDGQIFAEEFTLTEAAINTVLWGTLALSYFNRRRSSTQLAHFYTLCSRVLMVMALASYGIALVILNPLWGEEPITSTRLWNILLLAYGAPVLVAAAAWYFYEPQFKKIAAIVAGGGLFAFVTLEIRHFWHAALDLNLGTKNGEVYTYSAAWLVMAMITMLTGTRFGSKAGYQAGMGLLLLVIAKIFLYDMADLEGLLRVASFMGLGLALLALAWLYQRTASKDAGA